MTTSNFTELAEALRRQGIAVEVDVPLADHVSFRLGGPCELLVKPKTLSEIRAALAAVRAAGVPYYLLGNGSNLLVADEGYPGVVLLTTGLSRLEIAGNRITAEAGVSLAKLCTAAQKQGLSGLEFAFGIPGSVGGAIYMNAGAYGGEIKDALQSVTFLDEDGKENTLSGKDAGFAYRRSCFTDRDCVILSGTFELTPDDPAAIRARMDEILDRRRQKQPLEYPSAGSTFKRPPGHFAAALIEQCGLKGYRIGDAQVSEKHSGFVINRGNATCRDVDALIEHIQTTVQEQTGILLEPEVKRLG